MGYYFASAPLMIALLACGERSSPVRRFVGHTSDVETILGLWDAGSFHTVNSDDASRLEGGIAECWPASLLRKQ
jgi:hypothetical protein